MNILRMISKEKIIKELVEKYKSQKNIFSEEFCLISNEEINIIQKEFNTSYSIKELIEECYFLLKKPPQIPEITNELFILFLQGSPYAKPEEHLKLINPAENPNEISRRLAIKYLWRLYSDENHPHRSWHNVLETHLYPKVEREIIPLVLKDFWGECEIVKICEVKFASIFMKTCWIVIGKAGYECSYVFWVYVLHRYGWNVPSCIDYFYDKKDLSILIKKLEENKDRIFSNLLEITNIFAKHPFSIKEEP